ncbi:MAG: 16S rRNA (cytidine(1402)-2'-O)-methyltransferase [Elusimicrobia bacterium]|nr:16S rRNA (cytidine(1402)-2'-O)-methyltransferase [Elusimicrobiota bacterium]
MSLFLVATPLGNLEDLSARAKRVLGEVKAVYCEDTRRTRGLLTHLGLSTSLLRYDDHDDRELDRMRERLRRGDDLALVSDAGTPVLSDPGLRIVAAARADKVPVISVPGPCAAAAAVAASGLPGDSFVFMGFLPRSSGKRRKALGAAAVLEKTLVVYESPFRVVEMLEDAVAALGPDCQAAVCRELTKLHEEWLTGTADEVRGVLAGRAEILGEFVVVLHPSTKP